MIIITGASTGLVYGIVLIRAIHGNQRAIRLEKKLRPKVQKLVETINSLFAFGHEKMIPGLFFFLTLISKIG